jgi:methyl-accepting chemotaxis protein
LPAVMGMIMRTVKRSLGGEPAYAVESVTRIAGGDLTVPLQVRGDDDRSVLAAMQQMQERLPQRWAISAARPAPSPAPRSRSRPATRPVAAHRTAGRRAGADRVEHGGADRHRAPERRDARQASALAVNASEIANRGGEVVSEVVSTMGEINQASRKIVDIIGVIEGIAFQTNILALNAAVEAARRRAGPRLCRGGGRGAQPGAAQRQRGQGNQDADRQLGGAGGQRLDAGGQGRRDMQEVVGAVNA